MGGLRLKNPAEDLHAPKIFSKDKQEEVSEEKDETCDYCEKPVALDCRGCGQKLCRECIDKYPCKPGGGKAGDEERTRQKGGGW